MKMDVCSKHVYENLRNVLYALVRIPFGKIFQLTSSVMKMEVLAEVCKKAYGEVLSKY